MSVTPGTPPASTKYLPAAHTLQEAEPVASWYIPAGQTVHDVEPVASWKLPAMQLRHLSMASWFDATRAASEMYEPTGQFTHVLEAVAPVEEEYLPAAQIVQSAISSCIPVAEVASIVIPEVPPSSIK